MPKAKLFILSVALATLLPNWNAMATSPLPNTPGARIVSPVCVASGMPEAQLQSLQINLCNEAATLLTQRGFKVEILRLNDPRMKEQGRVIISLRAHAETVDGLGYVLNISSQLSGDGRMTPAAAHAAPFFETDQGTSPALRDALRLTLREHGLL